VLRHCSQIYCFNRVENYPHVGTTKIFYSFTRKKALIVLSPAEVDIGTTGSAADIDTDRIVTFVAQLEMFPPTVSKDCFLKHNFLDRHPSLTLTQDEGYRDLH
jgi:hypothetical protein